MKEEKPYNSKKYATRKDAYEAHKQRVMKWQSENPDKFRGYQQKYEQSERVKEMRKQKYRDMDPIKKEELLAKARARYAAKKLKDE